MPSKKKKYNARFPAGRIKKIMQTDEEVGKVAQAVPVIISRTLELFVESLLTKSMQITVTRNAKTLTPSHMKQCILSESRFDFLKDLVKNIPDPSTQEDNENNALEASEVLSRQSSEEDRCRINDDQSTSSSASAGHTSVIQYGPKVSHLVEQPRQQPAHQPKLNFSIENLVKTESKVDNRSERPLEPSSSKSSSSSSSNDNVPPLIPISSNINGPNNSDENDLYIDEDYDN